MRKILLLFIIPGICSCSTEDAEYRLISDNSGRNPFIIHAFPAFKGYFYEGSDKEYHYFVEKWKYRQDYYFKLRTDNLLLEEAFIYGDGQVRVNAFQSENAKEFGKTGFYKLYYAAP
jgi:hypothetical protein